MRQQNNITEGIARQLVGSKHATGEFVRYENRGGKVFLVSQCAQCGAPNSNISVTNAAQAAKNPNVRLIACQHCTYVVPGAAKQSYEEVIRIPEAQRSSAQQRIVVEHENAQRNQQRAAVKQAPIDRANKAVMWTQWERYVMSLAHSIGARTITAPEVLADAAYITWEQWQSATEESRYKVSADVDAYFEANSSLRYEG